VSAIRLRPRARLDIEAALDYYLGKQSFDAAEGFSRETEAALQHLSYLPASGSPRFAHLLDLPGLRTWPIADYPYLIFYIERTDLVDVMRILHTPRDISALLLEQ
jgi:toxin ParE1/3/4